AASRGAAPMLLLQWTAGLRHDAAWMQGMGVHAASPETSLEADREENVRRLRLTVGEPLVVRPALELDVVEHDRRHVMAARADGYHAARRGPEERRGERPGSREVDEVVREELQHEGISSRGRCVGQGV